VCSIHGIDLLADNVEACRERPLGVLAGSHEARFKEALPEGAGAAAAQK
jgi:hypothetical protein